MKETVRCSDGKTRTGQVIYIHPDNRFRVLEFTGTVGNWREAIIINNRSDGAVPYHQRPRKYSPDEDAIIMRLSPTDAAIALGRSRGSVSKRKQRLEAKV